jgi:hypothetical protein
MNYNKIKNTKKHKLFAWVKIFLLLILWLPIIYFIVVLATSDRIRNTKNILKIKTITGKTFPNSRNLICWYQNAPHGYTYWLRLDSSESMLKSLCSKVESYKTNDIDYIDDLFKYKHYPKHWLDDDFKVQYICTNSSSFVLIGKELNNTNIIVLEKGYHELPSLQQ